MRNQTPFSKFYVTPRMEDAAFRKMSIPEIYKMQQKKDPAIKAPTPYVAKIQILTSPVCQSNPECRLRLRISTMPHKRSKGWKSRELLNMYLNRIFQ